MDDRTKGLLGALGSYRQADMDGIMCEVSRQAVEEAADLIEQKAAELERLRADAERLFVLATKWVDAEHHDWDEIKSFARVFDPTRGE